MEQETGKIKKEEYPDVLADRYATPFMVNLWGQKNKVISLRRLWVAGLRSQREFGMLIPLEAIQAYESQVYKVNLDSIKQRELVTKQDVKANIEEFNALAGFELCHAGFTSRDETDNVEQLQILESLKYIRDHTVAILGRLELKMREFSVLRICGRSHLVPGQVTTLGKRFGNIAEELLRAFEKLEILIESYPMRGIKGAVGTQQDMYDLLENEEKVRGFENLIREYLGFGQVLRCVGQVYPRSLDYEVVSTLVQLSSACGNFAKMIRLMAGLDLAHEGFKEGQTASSAMPHKINSRTCERINGLVHVLGGYESMIKSLIGDQWFEGDVSCSVVRRVALPGAFFAMDGIIESMLTVLDEMQIFPEMITAELRKYLPFLSSTKILMAMVKKGMGREEAHAIIKKHALTSLKEVREGKENPFVELLCHNLSFLFMNPSEVYSIVSKPDDGLAFSQVMDVCGNQIFPILQKYLKAVDYIPEPIL
jgi:adenylosuccinate lyase